MGTLTRNRCGRQLRTSSDGHLEQVCWSNAYCAVHIFGLSSTLHVCKQVVARCGYGQLQCITGEEKKNDLEADQSRILSGESCYEVQFMRFGSSIAGAELRRPSESKFELVQSCDICVRISAGQCKTDAARPAYIARSRRCLDIKGG